MSLTRTAIETWSGRVFDFARPITADDIALDDIAVALGNLTRFGGHSRFYSVAEHAILVHNLVKAVAGPELALAALHHDSHEAYLGDIPKPLKLATGDPFAALAGQVDAAIAEKFGFDVALFNDEIIKAADYQALFIEAAALKRSKGIGLHWSHSRTTTHDIPPGAVLCHPPCDARWEFDNEHHCALAAFLAGRRTTHHVQTYKPRWTTAAEIRSSVRKALKA